MVVGNILGDYQITVKNLCEIVGKASIDNVIRLQSYKGTYDDIFRLVNVLEEPVIGLFCADDSRKNYGLFLFPRVLPQIYIFPKNP